MIAWLFGIVLYSALFTTAYVSLRWTRLDPQYPVERSKVATALLAIVSTLLVPMSASGTELAPIVAALAVGIVCGPAIAPPLYVTPEEQPMFFRRWWMKLWAVAFGSLTKAVVISLLTVILPILSILPFADEVPVWFAVLGLACALSIFTRPISLPLSPQSIDRTQVANPDLRPAMFKRRFVVLLTQSIWLILAYPLLDFAYMPNHGILEMSLAIFAGTVVSDLT